MPVIKHVVGCGPAPPTSINKSPWSKWNEVQLGPTGWMSRGDAFVSNSRTKTTLEGVIEAHQAQFNLQTHNLSLHLPHNPCRRPAQFYQPYRPSPMLRLDRNF